MTPVTRGAVDQDDGESVLALNFLGEIEVSRGGSSLALPQSRKTRALLAYLALMGRAQRRDRLCDIFWDVPDDPRGALRWSLSKLRPVLDEPGHIRVVADRDTVALDLSQTTVDVLALRAGLGASPADATTEVLLQAAAAFRGEFLQGLDLPECGDFQAWCAGERESARTLQTRILRELVERLADDPAAAIPHAQALVSLVPTEENARATLVRLLAADGRMAEAEQHYATGIRILERPGGRSNNELTRAWQDIAANGTDDTGERRRETDVPAVSASTRRTSIAVLPFDNLSSDPDQDYFVDGIVEDVITNLAHNRWLTVIARNSTFAYKGRATDVRQIGRDLGVRYVVEGSVRKVGDRIRITAQLVEAADGDHIWAERYDRDLEDIFQLQDEIANQIAATLEPELVAAESMRARAASPESLDAWDLYLRGIWHLYTFTSEDLEQARGFFERSIALDPDVAAVYARLAYVHIQRFWYGPHAERQNELDQAFALSRRAIVLDERDPVGHFVLGRAYALTGEYGNAIGELEQALDLNQNFAQAHFALGQALFYAAQPDAAIEHLDLALRLSPHDPHLWTFHTIKALVRYKLGDLEAAERSGWHAIRQANATHWAFATQVSILGQAGKKEDATRVLGELLSIQPKYSCTFAKADYGHLMDTDFVAYFIAGLRAAGVPE